MPIFITFEGIEGCGKTTQLARLAEKLRARGRQVLTTREPGGCPIADAIRKILLDPGNSDLAPRAELLLYAAARAQHVEEVVKPALEQGVLVLCDRFTDATLAYQGFGRGLDRNLIAELNDLAAGGLTPDLTLLLDMPVEHGLNRALGRNARSNLEQEGRFEAESLAFHQRVREGYLAICQNLPRYARIDALGSIEVVEERIDAAVTDFLKRRA